MTIDKIENLRKEAKKILSTGRKITLLAAGISLLILIIIQIMLGVFLYLINFIIPFFIFVAGMIITSIVSAKPIQEFNDAFKNMFVLKSLEKIFTDLKYEPSNGIEERVLEGTDMINTGDRFSSNDYVSGKYKNINVICSAVEIEEKHETTDDEGNKKTTWETIFKGKWMIFDFNKSFKANLQICQKGFGDEILNNGLYNNIKMEDQEFNNMFWINAQNDHEAFYILTPSFMEKIKKLSNTIDGTLLLCFVNNKLHVGLHNYDDSFEPDLYKEIDEEKITSEISKDIKQITDFVDELDLDNNLFRREV